MKKAILLFAIAAALALSALAGNLHVLMISGTSAPVQLQAAITAAGKTNNGKASAIQFKTAHGNSGTTRVGDSLTSSTVGLDLVADQGYKETANFNDSLTLTQWYVYVPTGDTLVVIWID